MNKIVLYITIFSLAICLAGCGSLSTSKDVYDSTFEPGARIDIDGGQAELVKVYTASRLYPTVHFGSYIQTDSEDMCYIDVVLDIKAGKKMLYSAELGNVTAVGNVSGKTYSDSICAIECDDNHNLRTNTSIQAGESALVHMAVEVPADTQDDEFEIKVDILSSTYSFFYEFGDCIDNMENIKKGQSISNQLCKVKLEDAYYSYELYSDAPPICDSDDGYVYLIAELDITNKSLEDADFRSLVSVSAVFDNEIYDARYLMEDVHVDNHFVSDGKISSLGSARVLAVIDLPMDYSSRSAKLQFALDSNEFSYKVDGDSGIAYERNQELKKQRAAEAVQQQAREEAARLAAEMDRLEAELKMQSEGEDAQTQAEPVEQQPETEQQPTEEQTNLNTTE